MIKVLLADDQPLIRAGFRALVEAEEDMRVVAEAQDGAEAVELCRRFLPHVALVDVQMPGMDGIEATRRIAADPRMAAVHVIMLTNYGLDEYVFNALRAGASGFLIKDMEPLDVLQGVRVAARGEALLAPSLTRRLIASFISHRPNPDPDRALAVLTPREREVLALVARGLTNEEIAERMVISPLTAKTHVSRVMGKVEARDRAQLVVIAYESGLVTRRSED